ncbi:MAG: phosphoribosyltransferase family protein [Promethearchaeati archaeon SRVP18_Atabeyarchaeia-1]
METETPASTSHLKDIMSRIRVVETLRLLKKTHTYAELSAASSLPVTVLNRYVKGRVLPSRDRSELLFKTFQDMFNLSQEVRKRIVFDKNGYFDNTPLLSDTLLSREIAREVARRFANRKVNKVISPAVDGIPIAVHVANELGVDLVIAKKAKEVGIESFIEESYVPSYSGVMMTLYLPRKAVSTKDKVIIVDDVIRSGETQRALIDVTNKLGATIVGIFILVAIGNLWEKELKLPPSCQMELLVKLPPPPRP